jgi:hypothetical protein
LIWLFPPLWQEGRQRWNITANAELLDPHNAIGTIGYIPDAASVDSRVGLSVAVIIADRGNVTADTPLKNK